MSGTVGPRLSTIPPTFFNDYSFEFDGTDDVVVINNTFDITNGLTMSCWVKFATTITSTNWLCSAGGTGGSNGYFNTRLAANGVWVNYLNGGAFFVLGISAAELKDGNWHHIAQTIDYANAEMRFYQDGVESTSVRAISLATTTAKINQIGAASVTSVYPFTGNIDEFAILEGAKTLTEIQEIYNSGVPTDLTSHSPLAWYKMGDNAIYRDPQWLLPSNENKDKVSNYSMSFDGTDDYMSTSVSSLNSTTAFTISFWGKKTSTTKTVGLNDKVTDTNKILLYWWSNGTIYLGARNGASNSSATFALSYDSDWHHFMGVYVGGTSLRLYVDGVLRDTITSSVPSSLSSVMGDNITIGYVDNTSYTTGNIDEVAIWNSDQSANVSTIYNGGVPSDLSSLNPINYCKMGENATFKDPQWLLPSNENKDKVSNYSMSFDGTDDSFIMAGDGSLSISGAFSVSIWMKGTSASSCHLFSRQFMYVQHTSVNKIRCRTFQTAGSFQTFETGTVNIYDGNWHHILVTYSVGGNAAIFLDGVIKTNPAATQTGFVGGNNPIGVGSNYLGNGSFFTGQLSDVSYWHNQDVSGDVSTIYSGGIPNDLAPLSPSVWLKMGDDATYNFSTSGWTSTNNGTTGIYDAESNNMDINDRIGDAPGSSGNTLSFNMDIYDRVGDAPNSENNALSYNMVLSGRTTDVPT
jgi:hypothetical protein